MNTRLSRRRSLAVACLLAAASSVTLVGCGGGGGGGSSSTTGSGSGGSGSGGSGGTGSGSGTATPATLMGVVATGAPLIGARVSVVDAAGTALGSTTTALADGSYQLTLNSASPTLPLFIEAAGVNMAGEPVLVHSVVQSLTSGTSARTVAHVNPLTNAVTALLLGTEPSFQFRHAGTLHGNWTLLGNSAAFTAASTWVKTAVKANLTDAKLTDLTKVDFFKDPSFVANKSGLDGAIEAVRVRFGKDLSGNELLQLSNRLIVAGTTEVTVNLGTAKSNLAGSTPAIAAGAVTSALKATTGNANVMPYVSGLNTLVSDINAVLAQGLAGTVSSSWFASLYTAFNGVDVTGITNLLRSYSSSQYQLSNWQILGCLDDPLPTRGCSKIHVGALVRDASGKVVDVFDNVVTYATATGWQLRGNDHQSALEIHPITWARWDATGALDTNVTPNPGVGMQAHVVSQAFVLATLRMPNGYAVGLNVTSASHADPLTLGTASTYDLITDEVLPSAMVGWVGTSDATPGAIYRITTQTLPSGGEDYTVRLTADLPSTSDTTVYPLPDGLSAGAPLTATNFVSGLTVAWDQWAAANPQMRMIEVRGVITTTGSPIKQSVTILPLSANQATLPVFTVPSSVTAVSYDLWLIAQDDQGRRYASKITALP